MTENPLSENKSTGELIRMLRFQAAEIRRLVMENKELKRRLAVYEEVQEQEVASSDVAGEDSIIPMQITPELASFFFSVFRGRADVYSRRIERKDGRTPLILTRFRGHAVLQQQLLNGKAQHIIVLHGGRSTKEREALRVKLREIMPGESAILIATGQYIGEGFNFPRLDTLLLATPIYWEGNVEQYAGRLHRDYEGKTDVVTWQSKCTLPVWVITHKCQKST